jgi:hypothetical protein
MAVKPYFTAISHLTTWFNTRFGDAIARQEIKSMKRDGSESAIAYANRVNMAVQALAVSPAESFGLFIDTISIGVDCEVLGSKIVELVTEGPDIYAVIKKNQAFELSSVFKANFKVNVKKMTNEPPSERIGDVFAVTNSGSGGRFKRNAAPSGGNAPNWKRQRFQRNASEQASKGPSCERCLNQEHSSEDCYHKNSKCFECGTIGHIGRACRRKKSRQTTNSRSVAAIVKKNELENGDVSGN